MPINWVPLLGRVEIVDNEIKAVHRFEYIDLR
jgi:hypothetical protein